MGCVKLNSTITHNSISVLTLPKFKKKNSYPDCKRLDKTQKIKYTHKFTKTNFKK